MPQSPSVSSVRHVTVDADRAGQRLDNFLIGQLGNVPRSLVYRLVRTGQVRVNGGRAKPMKKLREGDEVRIPPVANQPRADVRVPDELVDTIRQRIVHSDEELMVINKPSGLAMHGGSGIRFGLMDVLDRIEKGIHPVHRLDRATSGLVIVARSRRASVELQQAFKGRDVEKRYLTLLSGRLEEASMLIDRPLKKIRDASGQHRVIVADNGQPARTRFRLLETVGGFSYVEAIIETGRTHQIRAHAAAIDHAVAGDERYNQNPPPPGLKRLFLHAHYIGLPGPGKRMFSAPLPEELGEIIENLRSRPDTEN